MAAKLTKSGVPVESFWVELNLHVPGRGYSISVHTEHAEMQVYVSEKGRVIRAYETRPKAAATNSGDAQ